jgi:hypothetical protein
LIGKKGKRNNNGQHSRHHIFPQIKYHKVMLESEAEANLHGKEKLFTKPNVVVFFVAHAHCCSKFIMRHKSSIEEKLLNKKLDV